jgi:uncharacterized circularly permuted ATP-grasp superfamily protein
MTTAHPPGPTGQATPPASTDTDALGYRGLAEHFDGLVDEHGDVRTASRMLARALGDLGVEGLESVQRNAELSLLNQGITFTVYSDDQGTEKIFPVDVIPRIVTATRWAHIEAGLQQRLRALNMFLRDLYGEQRILRDGVVPTDLVVNSPHFCRAATSSSTSRAPT